MSIIREIIEIYLNDLFCYKFVADIFRNVESLFILSIISGTKSLANNLERILVPGICIGSSF